MRRKYLFYKENPRNLSYPMTEYPKVYNKEGKELELFYLKDQIMDTYCWSRYFMWDRCNYGLATHFYSHNNMLSTQGAPVSKYGVLIESRKIVPDNYRIFDKNKGLAEEFNYIFTYDAELLNKLPNARFFPVCSRVWYGRQEDDFWWEDKCYKQKSKNISILSSDKEMCEMHKLRIEVSRYCKRNGVADTFGTFDGGEYCLVDDTLKEYRYSIIIENDISDYFFTEKITNCFAAQTIPVYLGAAKIGEFFNVEGIIRVSEKELGDIEKILCKCTPEYYWEHIQAVLDNYQRVKKYQNVYDWLYEKYFIKRTG